MRDCDVLRMTARRITTRSRARLSKRESTDAQSAPAIPSVLVVGIKGSRSRSRSTPTPHAANVQRGSYS